MRTKLSLVVIALLALGSAVVCGAGPESQGFTAEPPRIQSRPPASLPELVAEAGDADTEVAAHAAQELRKLGPEGLDALLQVRKKVARLHVLNLDDHERIRRLDIAIDTVAAQRDGHVSRLYWYTDLEQAKAVAQQSGKPILSLRLLGNLTDELSCANSRFFRTTLYANEKVSDAMRERFVLHWSSERPVPRITIDFGGGRKLERTITGNSIHYVLDAEGRPVDALPGLYGPDAFLRHLAQDEKLVGELAAAELSERPEILRRFHEQQLAEIRESWQRDLEKVGVKLEDASPATLDEATTDKVWKQIAELHALEAKLDASSQRLMREKHMAAGAMRLAVTKALVEDPMRRVVMRFENSLAEDTVRNEYRLHRQLHEWFLAGEPENMVSLNERVYAELFLTPRSDPWLGLNPPDVYTAIGTETAAK